MFYHLNPWSKKWGPLQTDYTDYPPDLEAYARRDPERMVRQAKKLGNNIGRFMSLLLSGVFLWAKLRQAQKLMRLADKYGHARVETACQRALGFDLINVQRVERILKNAVAPSDDPVLCQNSAQSASTKEPCLSKSNSNSSTRTGYAAAANI